MLLVSFSLGAQIDCGVLCQKIQNAIVSLGHIENPYDKLLTISISDVSDGTIVNKIPLIEYKHEQ